MLQDIRKELDGLGLNTSAFKVICYLSFNDEALKPYDIAKGLGEKASTVRARLTELKKAGLVSSTSSGYISNLTSYDILMKLYKDIKKELSDDYEGDLFRDRLDP
jgi:predicted DNA-binding transcriptional regulator